MNNMENPVMQGARNVGFGVLCRKQPLYELIAAIF